MAVKLRLVRIGKRNHPAYRLCAMDARRARDGMYLENIGYVQQYPEAYKALVKKGKFMCRVCGRVAADMGHLCVPEKL